MSIEVRKKEGESAGSLIFRFTKKVQQSGILLEAKKRRFSTRPSNKRARRNSALYRLEKRKQIEKMQKAGML